MGAEASFVEVVSAFGLAATSAASDTTLARGTGEQLTTTGQFFGRSGWVMRGSRLAETVDYHAH